MTAWYSNSAATAAQHPKENQHQTAKPDDCYSASLVAGASGSAMEIATCWGLPIARVAIDREVFVVA